MRWKCVPLAIHLMAHAAQGEPNLEGLWRRWETERTAMLKRSGGEDRLDNLEVSYEISIHGKRMDEAGRSLLKVLSLLPAGVAHDDLPAILPHADRGPASTLRKAGLAFDEAGRIRVVAPLRVVRQRPDIRQTQGLMSPSSPVTYVSYDSMPTKWAAQRERRP